MKKNVILFIAALFVLNTNAFSQRGTIVQAMPLTTITPLQIMQNLQLEMSELNYALIDNFTYKKFNVQAIRIIYNTIDGKGYPTTASGVVFIPMAETNTYMPVFSYLHGTLTRDLDAPSNLIGTESIIGWIMAMDGYISVLPDYLGMGDGPGVHPYLHAESEVTSCVDIIKAANLLCSDPKIMAKPDGNLYLSGYSQGAHAALATQRELEINPLPNMTLRKTFAGSGAYSLSFIQKNFVFKNPEYPNPSFIPYLLLGYQNVYGNLYTDPSQAFVAPYNMTIPGLFNGLYTVEEIDNQLPVTWKSMFVPSYLSNFQYKYFNPVNIALRANDVINWKPTSDLHLYYCNCDELVAKENSLLAYLVFLLKGSHNVTCLPVGPFNHFDCAPVVLLLAKIHSDCASGVNPCGLNKPLNLGEKNASYEETLLLFEKALDGRETIDIDSVYANSQIADYLIAESGKERSLSIFPNPANDLVYIEIPIGLIENSRLCVYDIQGRLLLTENITSDIMKINVKEFKKGFYKIVLTGLNTYTGTLVVTR